MPVMTDGEYEALEGWESESESESEAAERAPLRRGSTRPSFRSRSAPSSTPMYVTQTQLAAALTRVDTKIKTVTDNVSTVNSRLTSLSSALKKEADERKRALDSQTKDLNQKLQMLALLPVLITPPSVTLAAPLATQGGGTVTSVSTPDNSTLDAILPLLLVSGLGGTSGFGIGGSDSGSTDNSMMMLALVLALTNK